jgi:DNA-binding beta-propeller fold protein YncE
VVIPVTYTVTGSVVSNTTYIVTPSGSIVVESPDTATTATATVSVYTDQLPPYTTYLIGQSQANGVVASGSWQANQQGGGVTGALTVNLKSPATIGPGVYSDSLKISVCYDQACSKEALGSPWVLPVTYTVTATAGVDYNANMLAVTANDIAWSSVTQKLYAAASGYSAKSPSTLLEIDPSTATVTRSLSLTGNPAVLSVSDDGSYAYVGFLDQSVIDRIALSTMSLDLAIQTPVDPTYGATYAAYLAALPGASRSVAVSLYSSSIELGDWESMGTYIYDDATRRPNTSYPRDITTRAMSLAFGADSSTLYAYDGAQHHLFTTAVSSTGLLESNEAAGVSIFGNLYYLNGLIYSDDGSVTDPASGAKVGTFVDTSSVGEPLVAVDGSLNRAYFFYQDDTSPELLWTFATYDLQTQKVIAKARVSGCSLIVGGVNGKRGRLVRFGADGLAVACNEGIEVISGRFVTN